MKKSTKRMLTITFTALLFFAVVVAYGYGIWWLAFDTQRIQGQELMHETISPSGMYHVSAYLNNGGATTSFSVLVVAENIRTGRVKNIYWEYRCEEAVMEWVDEETIHINDQVLNVRKDVYDWRH